MKVDAIYTEKEDILYLGKKSVETKYSLSLSDMYVVDFDAEDRVIGIEILDASEMVHGFSKNFLKNIIEARIFPHVYEDHITIGFMVASSVAEDIRSSIAVPIPA
jgi:uncharacterized protein YuzE